MKQGMLIVITIILSMTLLASCAANPDQTVVISKNDGSFDIEVAESAPDSIEPGSSKEIDVIDSFTSTDGTVQFQFNLHETLQLENMPIVEITPHYLTAEDAKRVAGVLFGNVECYEKGPTVNNTLTRTDIQNSIARWMPYTSTDNLMDLFGNDLDTDSAQSMADDVKAYIEAYNLLYETAPDGNLQPLCDWEFKPDSYYEGGEADSNSGSNEEISIELSVNDIPYVLTFCRRNKSDFKLNYIYAYPNYGSSPWGIDSYILNKQMCRTEKPNDEQIAQIGQKAQQMLDNMGLGEWLVDECYLETVYLGVYEYHVIYVNAVPVINGVPAVRRPQLTDLNSKENFASNYYLTDACFQFSANGELKKFEMYSTIDIANVLNENVATLTMEQLIDQAKQQLSLSDFYEYGLGAEELDRLALDHGEEIMCNINICEIDYGLTRVKVPDTDESYYYLPAVFFGGTIEYIGKSSGTIYASSGKEIWEEEIITLLGINAIDGSIIAIDNW